MSPEQLKQVIAEIEREETKARKAQMQSQVDVLTQKKWLARSYLVDQDQLQSGRTYEVIGEDQSFTLSYLNGIMAWGKWGQSTALVAVPIAKLKISEQHDD